MEDPISAFEEVDNCPGEEVSSGRFMVWNWSDMVR